MEKILKKAGLNTLSYFISNDINNINILNKTSFIECYDKDAKFIDPSSITEISNTINSLLMQK